LPGNIGALFHLQNSVFSTGNKNKDEREEIKGKGIHSQV
jgi:hypothetical protein